MKSIKEKAEEYHRVIRVINKHSTIVDTQCSEMFVKGANYVLSVLYDVAYKEDWIANPKDGIRRFFDVYRQLKK